LAALDGAVVISKLFDTGGGHGKLIAMLIQFFFGKARVSSKRSLLFGVGRDLLLSRGIRGSGFGREMEASGRRESQASRDERKNGSMQGTLRHARCAGWKAGSHT